MTKIIWELLYNLFNKKYFIGYKKTIVMYIKNPKRYFSSASKTGWKNNAYLTGLFMSSIAVFIWWAKDVMKGSKPLDALIYFCIQLLVWLSSAYITYYLYSWCLELALVWTIKDNRIEDVRPNLFLPMIFGPTYFLPYIGRYLCFVVSTIWIVRGYSYLLKCGTFKAIKIYILADIITVLVIAVTLIPIVGVFYLFGVDPFQLLNTYRNAI